MLSSLDHLALISRAKLFLVHFKDELSLREILIYLSIRAKLGCLYATKQRVHVTFNYIISVIRIRFLLRFEAFYKVI